MKKNKKLMHEEEKEKKTRIKDQTKKGRKDDRRRNIDL